MKREERDSIVSVNALFRVKFKFLEMILSILITL